MWSCNGSASPVVCPERRVLPIVTMWAAVDHPLAGEPSCRRKTAHHDLIVTQPIGVSP